MLILVVIISCFGIIGAVGLPAPVVPTELPTSRPEYNDTDLSTVHFLLFTQANSIDPYEIVPSDFPNLIESPFDDNRRTYFLFHGWGGSPYEGYQIETTELLLKWSNCQVFRVDYEEAASVTNYDKAVFNVFQVAEYSASFIDYLVETTSLTTDQIHIIGHSLGGQTAGLTAQYVSTGLIDRVTGLDPAGPLFYTQPPENRLDPTDGAFVDVIHSNGCRVTNMCYGENAPVGHIDFYPNGGRHQAGCIAATDFITGCSHARAHDYWVESLKAPFDPDFQEQFWAYPCEDYEAFNNETCILDSSKSVIMGFRTSREETGSFFLDTNRKSPFAQGRLL